MQTRLFLKRKQVDQQKQINPNQGQHPQKQEEQTESQTALQAKPPPAQRQRLTTRLLRPRKHPTL